MSDEGSIPSGNSLWGCNSVEEYLLCKQEAEGSNPSSSTLSEYGSVWLERLIWDQEVVGSNPAIPTENLYMFHSTSKT